MSDEFKRFIDTGGKTLDEIRKTIEKMLNNTVESVVDEAAKLVSKDLRDQIKQAVRDSRKSSDGYYKPEKIPPRDAARPVSRPVSREPVRAAYPREPIAEHMSAQDELMLDKIGEMRSLEETSDNSYITKRCAEITMVRQGTFMAEVEDDFNRRVFCALPQPVYMAMSNSQLRTYFTWRTDARRGKFYEVDKPYVLLYCYELLNKIGVTSAAEAFGKLLELWDGCRGFAWYLDEILPRWLKDFYVYNDITELYPDINPYLNITEGNSRNRCMEDIENGIFTEKLDYLAEYSAYNIKGSIFLSEKTKPLLDGACAEAMEALSKYFKERGIDITELLCGKARKDFAWVPFRGAVVDLERTDGFRPVKINASERYCIKRGEPSLEVFDFSPSRGFIGYLLKSVEAELRRHTKFNRRLIPNITMLENDIRNREKLMSAVSESAFREIIPAAVTEFCRKNGIRTERNPKKKTEEAASEYVRERVEIDVSKLSRIREQSDELAKKLIVEEPPVLDDSEINEEFIEEISARIADDDFSERIADCAELSPADDEEMAPPANEAFFSLPEEWQAFANELTPTHLTVLSLMPDGTAEEYCRKNGIMPETIYEEVNTAALDNISDVVIEGGEILPDYFDEIAGIVKASGIKK